MEKLQNAYFLSLELENVRCFGERQRIDFSDGESNPKQWTIILGDNGTGKTTILQSLAATSPISIDVELGDNHSKKVVSGNFVLFDSDEKGIYKSKSDVSGGKRFRVCLNFSNNNKIFGFCRSQRPTFPYLTANNEQLTANNGQLRA